MTSPVGHGLLWGAALVLLGLTAYVWVVMAVTPAVGFTAALAFLTGGLGIAVVRT